MYYADGRSAREGDDGYLHGAPELVIEISISSASYDLHSKLNAYRRNGVQEYIVWRVFDEAIDWFGLVEGAYRAMAPDEQGVVHSSIFPGLRLDRVKMLAGDLKAVLREQRRGEPKT
jgi:Uma2 family endonuclease